MAFPSSPINGQTAVVNGITFTYSSTTQSWTRSSTPSNFSVVYNAGSTPPVTNIYPGNQWYNTATDVLYEYAYDGVNYYWVDITTPVINSIAPNISNFTANTITSSTGSLYIASNLYATSNVFVSNAISSTTGNIYLNSNVYVASNTVAGSYTRVEYNVPHPFLLMGAA